jgi:transcriptional regulator with XRE-family HTH domain
MSLDRWEMQGKALREFREAAGISQGEVADEIPINRGSLSLMETGKLRIPEDLPARYRAAVQTIVARRAQAVGVAVLAP